MVIVDKSHRGWRLLRANRPQGAPASQGRRRHPRLAPGAFALIALAVFGAWGAGARADSKLTVIYSFRYSRGSLPQAGLLADAAGNLYGTTSAGGPNGLGVVFRLSPSTSGKKAWTETVLYAFDGTDGATPNSKLVEDGAGNLYGTTRSGGHNSWGVVFQLRPPAGGGKSWTETVLYAPYGVSGEALGFDSGLMADAAGKFYGTTGGGGALGAGAVFELSPPAQGQSAWTTTVLYSFNSQGTAPFQPIGGVIANGQGNLYGIAAQGGANAVGAVYQLSPKAGGKAWSGRVIHSFDISDGSQPSGGLTIDAAGDLYGTTAAGGASGVGVVFEMSPPALGRTAWNETVLHSFDGPDGAHPNADLLIDGAGAIYGTTLNGGAHDAGVAFELSPPPSGRTHWHEKVLQSFDGTHGKSPQGGLIADAVGNLFGTTNEAGVLGVGVAFELTH